MTGFSRRSRRLALIFAGVAVLGMTLFLASGALAGWVLKKALADLMESGVAVTIHSPDPRALDLSVRFPDLGVRLDHLRPKTHFIGFLPPEIGLTLDHPVPSLRLKGIDIADARLTVDSRYAWSGLWTVKVRLRSPKAEVAGMAARHVNCEIVVDNASVQFDLNSQMRGGPLRAILKGEGRVGAALDLKGKFEVRSPYLEAESPFELLRHDGDEIIQIGSAGASFRTYYGSGHGFRFGISNKMGSFDLKIDRFHPRVPEAIRELVRRASLGLDVKGRRDDVEYVLLGEVTEKFSGVKTRLHGSLKNHSGQNAPGLMTLEFSLPLDFEKQTLFDVTDNSGQFQNWSGTGKLSGRFTRSAAGSIDGSFVTEIGPLKGSWNAVPFEGLRLKSDIRVVNDAVKGKGVQTLQIERLGNAFQVRRVELDALLLSSSKINIVRLEAALARGRLYARPFDVHFPSYDFATEIKIDDFDLGEGAKGFQLDAISAEGKAHARVPLSLEAGRLQFFNARIENVGPGVVHYKDPSVAHVQKSITLLDEFSALLSMGQQALVFKALDNFHFERLQLEFSRGLKTDTEIVIRLKGKNPDLAKGQPFELNLPLTGQIEKLLLQSLLKSLMEKEQWEQQIEKWGAERSSRGR